MLTTTFRLAHEAGACISSYRKFAKHVGGIKRYGMDTPIFLAGIADVCGIDDALWCLDCTREPKQAEKLARLLAADFAEHVLHFFEKVYPEDNRPRKAIEAARLFAEGKMDNAAWAAAGAAAGAAARAAWDAAGAAAGDAARAAAGAAAGAAAWDAAGAAAWAAAGAAAWAARAAAWAAEQEWQLKRFKEAVG